jgi:acyl carrier protein
MDKVATGLTKCFAAVFPELSAEEILAATPATVKSWDSVATLNLLTVIEEEFGIEIDFTKLLESLSYEQIAAYIRTRLATQESQGAA